MYEFCEAGFGWALQGAVRQGGARHDLAWQGSQRGAQHLAKGAVRGGANRLGQRGMAWRGEVWLAQARCGEPRPGTARCGWARQGLQCNVQRLRKRVLCSVVGRGLVWRGEVWLAQAWQSSARQGLLCSRLQILRSLPSGAMRTLTDTQVEKR